MKRKSDEISTCSNSSTQNVRANEVIDLIFIEASTEKAFLTNPTFTHQIFPYEQITYLNSGHDHRIKIFVDCKNLSQYIKFDRHFSDDQKQKLLNNLSVALPKDYDLLTSDKFPMNGTNTITPSGRCVHTFQTGSDSYEIWLTKYSDEGSHTLLQRAEKLAMWFIETADSIDFSDDRWEALFIYKVKMESNVTTTTTTRSSSFSSNSNDNLKKCYYFGGYFTLFSFRNPFVGTKLRICQALILPHLQGIGLGKEMLLIVYQLIQSRNDVVEVTVEDPAPGFQRLRDHVDYEWYTTQRQNMKYSENTENKTMTTMTRKNIFRHSMNASQDNIQWVIQHLKLTKAQASFVVETDIFAHIYHSIYPSSSSSSSSPQIPSKIDLEVLEESVEFKKFRLDVKRRLLSEHIDLKKYTQVKRHKCLEDMFECQLKRILHLQSRFKTSSSSS